VYARRVDSSVLVFSLSSHRHSYIGLVFSSRFIEFLQTQKVEGWRTASASISHYMYACIHAPILVTSVASRHFPRSHHPDPGLILLHQLGDDVLLFLGHVDEDTHRRLDSSCVTREEVCGQGWE